MRYSLLPNCKKIVINMKADKVRFSRFIRDLKLTEAEKASLIESSVEGEDGEYWLTQESINSFLADYVRERSISLSKVTKGVIMSALKSTTVVLHESFSNTHESNQCKNF